ncbi:shikimate dehydrogenase family protein [Prochlorococcus marinus]|uniref:Shikimate dehydrogenase substrate binding N-terminal domain-containing protein n=1 Tax=Prochlorococcus marinus XMU1408 TaxID=2213228 RepID=A0A318QVV9_PROMR|nr:hypothetical protein [Prochlorococcus marinus]MBW3042887.1 hypothetical protein [Prochlorococcus marinus str. XMU1408]PYE00245.1 hypothetical protein DNJ73_09190 [Prochlorococcus marinus XMU1408]
MFSLIIGISPSKGARSPSLWNKAYKNYKINCEMKACDISNESELNTLIEKLKFDNNFQGGSVTFPYKEKVAEILQNSLKDEATSRLGAINCLYRNKSGVLCGANTDGLAAVSSVNSIFFNREVLPQKILILGVGGVGKAVIAFLSEFLLTDYPGIELCATSRNKDNLFFSRFKNVNYIKWNDRHKYLTNQTLLINCTSLGDYQNLDFSPISLDLVDTHNKPIGIFDVIHTPSLTKLLLWAKDKKINYCNGIDMNLMQAAIAFKYATNVDESIANIQQSMIG